MSTRKHSEAAVVTLLADADQVRLLPVAGGNLKSITGLNLRAPMPLLAGRSGGQTLIGGTGVTDALALQGTSGNGTAGSAALKALVGNNGATTAWTVLNNGNMGVGIALPTFRFAVSGDGVDQIGLGHDGTDAYIRTTDGSIILKTDEGTHTDTVVEVKPKGNSMFGRLVLYRSGATGTYFASGRIAGGVPFSGSQGLVIETTDVGNSPGMGFHTANSALGHIAFAPRGSEAMRLTSDGRLGVNTTAPDKSLEINLGTSDALRLTYNDSNGSATTFMDTTLSSVGLCTFTAAGSAPGFAFSAPVRLKGYTVGTLPTGTQGDTAFVTDATAPTYLGALVGGGAVVCPVFHNGSAWVSN